MATFLRSVTTSDRGCIELSGAGQSWFQIQALDSVYVILGKSCLYPESQYLYLWMEVMIYPL